MEMELIVRGFSQSDAHEITCKKYNYPKATSEFYQKLVSEYKSTLPKTENAQISGGITVGQEKNWSFML